MRSLLTPTAICASVSIVVLTGCGVRDTDRARSVAEKFTVAMEKHDYSTAQSLLTAKARASMKEFFERAQPTSDTTPEIAFDTAIIDGDLATVPGRSLDPKQPGTMDILLRREEREWRVYAMRMSGDGKTFTLDFEHPEQMFGELLGLMVGELAKGLAGAAEGFSKAAPDAEKAGRALGQLIGGFAKGMEEGVKETAPNLASPAPEAPVLRRD